MAPPSSVPVSPSPHSFSTGPQNTELSISVHNLLFEAHSLFHELSLFEKYMKDQGKEDTVDLRTFRASVSSELKSLERVLHYLNLLGN